MLTGRCKKLRINNKGEILKARWLFEQRKAITKHNELDENVYSVGKTTNGKIIVKVENKSSAKVHLCESLEDLFDKDICPTSIIKLAQDYTGEHKTSFLDI